MHCNIQGTWIFEKAVNFEAYMNAVGVPAELQKAVQGVKNTLHITVNGDHYHITQTSSIKNTELDFTLNKEFDQITPDGRKVKSIVYRQGDKLIQDQKAAGVADSVVERWIENGRLICILRSGDVACRREYIPVP